jgi:hypothetical protein
MRYILSTALALTIAANFFPNVSLACSGPGVGAIADGNDRLSVQLFAVACFLFLAIAALFLIRRNLASIVITLLAAVVLAVHPVWTVTAGGDCGGHRAMSSLKSTGFIEVLFFAQLALWLFPFVFPRRA